MWVGPAVCGPAAANVGRVAANEGQKALLFADNVVSKLRCLWACNNSFVGRYTYQSISKTKTFTPPSSDRTYILAQLSKNTENACIKARRHNLAARKVFFMLRTQDFRHRGIEIKLSAPTQCPSTIIKLIDRHLDRLLENNTRYRLTGVVLSDLKVNTTLQYDLFGEVAQEVKARRVFEAIDRLDRKYGKHTVFLGSSFAALNKAQHQGERAERPQRRQNAFKGETERQRIGLPLLGEVT